MRCCPPLWRSWVAVSRIESQPTRVSNGDSSGEVNTSVFQGCTNSSLGLTSDQGATWPWLKLEGSGSSAGLGECSGDVVRWVWNPSIEPSRCSRRPLTY